MSSILDSQIRAAEQEWLDNWKRGPKRLRWVKPPLQVGDAGTCSSSSGVCNLGARTGLGPA